MPDLIIYTIDGRRNIWRGVDDDWLDMLADQKADDFIMCSNEDPVIRVGSIASIEVAKEGEK